MASGNLTQVYYNVHSRQISDVFSDIGIHTKHHTPTSAKHHLKGFTKLLVVRNPMDRLISAYTDKIVFFNKYVNNEYKEFSLPQTHKFSRGDLANSNFRPLFGDVNK